MLLSSRCLHSPRRQRAGHESQLARAIRARIEKGDKAKDKAEQHYIAVGQHLKQLKDDCPDQKTFLEKVEREIEIGKSRTYELLQIGDGRKTVTKVRADTAKRTADTKARLKLSATSGQNADDPRASADAEQEEADKRECIALWQKVQQAEMEAAGDADDNRAEGSPRCTFCRKCHHHAQLLIAAPDGIHGICDECVDLCTDIVREHREKVARVNGTAPAESPPASPRNGENSDDPAASAEAMKAQFAAAADPWDAVGDFPDAYRRAPKVAAS